MSEGKILIMGVGGCGSGFIWNVLKRCGLDTTELREWIRHSGIRTAFNNGTIATFPTPKVIKHLGGFLNNLNKHLDDYGWSVEHIFFCVASFELQMKSYKKRCKGMFDLEQYTEKYQKGLGKGLIQVIERDYPFTIVRCPRSIKDPRYCYDSLKIVLGGMPYEEFYTYHSNQISPRHFKRLDGFE